MGKAIKIIFIVILVIVLLAVGLLLAMCAIADYHNKHYYKYATPYGEIEKKYTPLGELKVSSLEEKSKDYGKFEVWYPTDMKEGQKYPLVIMANGTGIKASQYKEVFEHLASWGFVVAGNEDDNSRSGASSSATLDFVLKLNGDKKSKLYSKIDVDNIGIAGHSQGGVGAINAVTEQENGIKYKAIWAASATSRYHADVLNKDADGWTCNPAKINIPVMMVAGTGMMDAGNMDRYVSSLKDGEAQGICPQWWLDECFAAIPAQTKLVARLKDKDHGDMLRYADGYMTAWFVYHLQGDNSADFFGGSNAEILTNTNWQNAKNVK